MTGDYIVGAGAAASILKMVFPEAKIISPAVSKSPDLFYLWDSKLVRTFLDKYKIPFFETQVKVGYYPSKLSRKQIELYNKITYKEKNSLPSKGKESFTALQCDIPEARIDIEAKVEDVKFYKKKLILDGGLQLGYDRLFWTAPHIKQLYSPITFVKCKLKSGSLEHNYIYLLDEELLNMGAYRLSRNKNSYLLEIAGAADPDVALAAVAKVGEKLGISLKFFSYRVRAFGHVKKHISVPDMPYAGVFYFGRYAQLDHEIMLTDVIEKALRMNGG